MIIDVIKFKRVKKSAIVKEDKKKNPSYKRC